LETKRKEMIEGNLNLLAEASGEQPENVLPTGENVGLNECTMLMNQMLKVTINVFRLD